MYDIYTDKREKATEKAKRDNDPNVVNDNSKQVEAFIQKRGMPQIRAERKYADYESYRRNGAEHREAMQMAGISNVNWRYWTSKQWIPKEIL